jgi:hypothetical protein
MVGLSKCRKKTKKEIKIQFGSRGQHLEPPPLKLLFVIFATVSGVHKRWFRYLCVSTN